ncbi:MAG: 2OG-Fe(II) oxygenase [Acidobacteriota bacterium]|nr:2OG-Fe(II) oxygenase [Acidobacteriota bacterium]
MSIKKTRQPSHRAGSRKSAGRNKSLPVFVKRDFLTKSELRGLTRYVLTHEPDFTDSSVIPDGVPEGANDPSYRKSRVLYELGEYQTLIQDRLTALLPDALKLFHLEPFPISHIDTQITASNDGDFFKVHQDNAPVEPLDISRREISYVHYFNSEPKAFSGGQLRFYDAEDGEVQSSEKKRARTITPSQNTLVLFPSSYNHEVLPVKCRTHKFAHSRFTANGWVIREETPSDEANASYPQESPDMGWLIDAAKALAVPRPYAIPKLYLTLEEASEYSGLSYEYLEQLVQKRKLTAIDDGDWKIRRADLENL